MKMYTEEVEKSRESYEMLGLGIGLFQGGVNLFLNSVVLGTLYYGGYLMSEQRLTPGDLMSFLVATQTIQRSLGQMSLVFGQAIKGTYSFIVFTSRAAAWSRDGLECSCGSCSGDV